MNRRRILVVAAVGLCAALWTYACGDGATEPPPPTPDPPRPASVVVAPATVQLTALGATEQLTAEVRDQNGQVMAGAAVTWASSAAAVATVSNSGLVTAIANGTATITATAGSASGSAAVTVAQEASAVAVTPAADTVVAGDTLRLAAEATDANGHPVAGAEVDWESGDTAIAVVDVSGLVTGVAVGEVEITATSSGAAGRAAITVADPATTTIAVTPDTVALTALGQTAQLAAEVRDQAGRVMAGVAVTWSSADTLVATVDSAGLVTAAGGGATWVTATAGETSGEAAVTVMQSAGSVVVSPAADTIAPGDTLRLVAEAFDENGHAVEGAEFAWSSSSVSVAMVDGSGLVRGIAEGTATITATAGDARGTAQITVTNLDRAALVALYNATDGPNWVNNENWLTDAPLREWYGVSTDASRRVVRVDLAGSWDGEARVYVPHGLSGRIPAELGSLANLTWLNLWNNALTGPIPAELGSLANLTRLDLWGNQLTGRIPAELGSLANLTWLNLGGNELAGPIPAELGSLANLTGLDLVNNALTGPIPPELGSLANLTWLSLRHNQLTGPIPQSFLQLDRLFGFQVGRNESLCVPGSSAFVAWLRGIEHRDDDSETVFCNAADVAALKQLYQTAGGTDWTESTGWPGDGAVEEWHGVSADSLGRVTALDLSRNGLAGRLPRGLDAMAHMTELRVGGNPGLSGRLPLSLARLALRALHYSGTGLCAPAEPSFRAWLGAIPSHEGTGAQCAPLSDRDVLQALYDATSGPDWTNNDNWLTDAPLGQWHGIRVDGEDRVTVLELWDNNLKGPIPPELGKLANLTSLWLGQNDLTGPIPTELGDLSRLASLSVGSNKLTGLIPPELGKLSNLRYLGLSFNDSMGPIPPEIGNLANLTGLWAQATGLSGSIPPELGKLANLQDLLLGYGNNTLTGRIPPEIGNLANLERLDLWNNALTGPIPPELGNLESLVSLQLYGNNLTGPIPPGLGNLANLESLWLNSNGLSGPIPPELGKLRTLKLARLDHNALTGSLPPALGNLTTVEELHLGSNDLEGPVPSVFGRMSSLRELSLTNNAAMKGPLPTDLTSLHALDALLAGGTDLCAPSNPDFQAWLEGVHKRRIAPCAAGGPAAAYLTQAVQSREFPVPLVAGEEAQLRVFVTAEQATGAGIPRVRARFYRNGGETHVVEVPGKSDPIPTEVDESSLSRSANAEIPGNVVQPGLEMVIEVDPDGTLDPALGVAKRIPETGRLAVDVRTMPLFDLTLIPFVWTETHDSSVVDLVEAMVQDPENHEMLADTRTLLPIGDFAVTAHEPVLSSSNDAGMLFGQTEAIRAMEGGTGHYKGMMAPPVTSARGIGKIGGRWSFSQPYPDILAHELGHNLSLRHPPGCDAGGTDGAFPYSGASIGSWGYDSRVGRLVRPSTPDVMSYCGPPDWISDYHFTNALRYRLVDEGSAAGAAVAASTRSLLLWGGLSADSVPFLEPAFVVDAPAFLPDSAGGHRITGYTAGGAELFSLSFTMSETADGDGRSSFAFVLPVRPGWEGTLASITLSGPGGSARLDGDTDLPMAILRNPRTRQIRGIISNPPLETQAAADAGAALAPGLEVLLSRGIPDTAAWRR